MMHDKFIDHEELHGLLRGTVEENDIGVTFAPNLLLNGEVNDDLILIFKVDSYYNSTQMNNPPKSVDYFVVVRCEHNHGYDAYIIELRNVGDTSGVKPREIRKKFETVFQDFFVKFSNEFDEILSNLNSLKLYLITDPLGLKGKGLNDSDIAARIKDTVIEAFGFLAPFEFLGKPYLIEVKIPDPVIPAC
ncbi:hypothetical protein ACEPUD_27095 [Burkholderia ubonensis]|uniref:hypothetical protein n=1 Tax=Burkholderia ubonensis TaxID=101571 RepID=UPI00358EA366